MRLYYWLFIIFLITTCVSREYTTHQNIESNNLELINKGLLEIPDSVIKKSYRNIDISFNNISKLPDHWLIKQNILQTLTADFNNFSSLPLDSLPKNYVNSLSFQANQIYVIPQSICSFDSLQTINLKENQINVIPDCIWTLAKLTKMNLSFNNLNSIYPSTYSSNIR